MIISNLGSNNKIENADVIERGGICIKGNNNTVQMPKNLEGMCTINISGNGHHVQIENDVKISENLYIDVFGDSGYIHIGQGTTIVDLKILVDESKNRVEIGKDCMFSRGIYILATDSHSIIDLESGECINCSESGVIIKDHVWIGLNATILKNTVIHENTIIATASVVSGEILANSIAGGIPAKTLRSNVTWDRQKPCKNIPDKEVENLGNVEDSEDQKTCVDEMFPSVANRPTKRSIVGWAYITNKDSYNSKIYIEITSKDREVRTFETTSTMREDVSRAFNNEQYGNSGFKSILSPDIDVGSIVKIRVICINDEQKTSSTVFPH